LMAAEDRNSQIGPRDPIDRVEPFVAQSRRIVLPARGDQSDDDAA
jgi:hypothetical protein